MLLSQRPFQLSLSSDDRVVEPSAGEKRKAAHQGARPDRPAPPGASPPPSPSQSIVGQRRKGGRGPGKHPNKTILPIRWEENQLSDQLLETILTDEKWSTVLPVTATGENSRTVLGIPKSELHRQIALSIFADDPRYDVSNPSTLDALGVSVKNRVNKIRKLFEACEEELGVGAAALADENDIIPGTELAAAWDSVRARFPLFFPVRAAMNRSAAQIAELTPTSFPGELDPARQATPSSGRSAHLLLPGLQAPSPLITYSPHLPTSPMESSYTGHVRSPAPALSLPEGHGAENSGSPSQFPWNTPYPDTRGHGTRSFASYELLQAVFDQGSSSNPGTPSGSVLPPKVTSKQDASDSAGFSSYGAQQHSAPLNTPGNYHAQMSQSHGGGEGHSGLYGGFTGVDPQAHGSSEYSQLMPPPPPPPGQHSPGTPAPNHDDSNPPMFPSEDMDDLQKSLFLMFGMIESRKRKRDDEELALRRLELEHVEREHQRLETERQRWHDRELVRLNIRLEQEKRGELVPATSEEALRDPHPDSYVSDAQGMAGRSGASSTQPRPTRLLPQRAQSGVSRPFTGSASRMPTRTASYAGHRTMVAHASPTTSAATQQSHATQGYGRPATGPGFGISTNSPGLMSSDPNVSYRPPSASRAAFAFPSTPASLSRGAVQHVPSHSGLSESVDPRLAQTSPSSYGESYDQTASSSTHMQQ